MPIATRVDKSIDRASWIRKMFEEGSKLKARFGEDNVFDFSLGNPDLPPPKELSDTLKDISQESHPGVHGYMPNAGFLDTRESVAQKVSKDHGIHLESKHIVMTCGAAGGLNVVLKTILDPDDSVIVLKPYFVEYGFYIENHNGRMILVETNDDFSLNIDKIKDALGEKTRAILINSPNNPTGKVYSEGKIKALSKILRDHSKDLGRPLYLISDEPYREIVYDGIIVPSILSHYEYSIVVTSYSKALSIPGERIGYIAVNPLCDGVDKLIAGLIFSNRILGFVNAPALMQRVISRLNDIYVNTDIYKRRRDIFMDGLQNAGYHFSKPEGAFYIFCKSPIEDDIQFVRHLQKYNILVVPGFGFGGPGYFRISYTTGEALIERALPNFKKALEEL